MLALAAALLTPMEIPGGLDLHSDAEHAAKAFGGDVGHYIDYADSLRRTGKPYEGAFSRLFPPGTSLWIMLIFELAGRGDYLWHQLLVTVALWATAFCFLYRSLSFINPGPIRFLVINSVWLFHSFTDWCLKTGSFFSESKSMPFFVMAIACLAVAIREKRRAFWVGSAIAMSLATYTRVYFETVGQFIFGAALIACAWNYYRLKSDNEKRGEARLAFRSAGIALVLFVVSLFPWKWMNKHLGGWGFHMAPAHYLTTFTNLWIPSDELLEFVIAGNSACVADPELCQIFRTIREKHKQEISYRVYKTAALGTLVTRANRWYAHRLSHFWKFWSDRPMPSSSVSAFRAYFEGTFILALWAIGFVVSLMQLRYRDERSVWACVFLAFTVQSFLMFTFAGMDYRHSLPVRLFLFYGFILGAGFLGRVSLPFARLVPKEA